MGITGPHSKWQSGDDSYPHRVPLGKAAALVAGESVLSVLYSTTEGADVAQVVQGATITVTLVVAGLIVLRSTGPVFVDRVRWVAGVGAVAAGVVVPGLMVSTHSLAATLGVIAAVLAVVWWSSSRHRGGGWTQSYLVRAGDYGICANCYMAGRRQVMCKYCGAGTPR